MKTVSVTDLPLGAEFTYKGEKFKVSDRDTYPIIEADRVGGGMGMCFWNFEKVEVSDDTKVYKQVFVELSKNHFVRREILE